VSCLLVPLRKVCIKLPSPVLSVHSDAARGALPLPSWKQGASYGRGGALCNCGYETGLIAQDAETCLEIKLTATSDWRAAKLSAFAANESPAGSLFKAYLTLILLTWKIW